MNKLPSVVREKAFWVLWLSGLLYFSPPLFFGKTFFFRDLYLHFFFRKQLLAGFLRSGQIPLWNEFLHGGRPYWGDLSNAVLHPSNILYAFFSPITAFNLIIVAHFLLAGAAMYVFVRNLGFKPSSSFLAGVIFEFCGYTLSLGNMLGFLLALPYLPLLFLGWHRFLFTTRRRWLLLALACGVIQVFAGAPELCVLSLILLFGWTVGCPYPRFSLLRRTLFYGGFGVCLLGLSAIQLLPTLEMIAASSRGAGIPYQAFAQWSLHPKRLAEFIFPGISGYLDQFPWGVYYWGKNLVDLHYPYVISLYCGAVTLILAFGSLSELTPRPPLLGREGEKRGNSEKSLLPVFSQEKGPEGEFFPTPVRRWFLALTICSLILAFGRFWPAFKFLYTYVPLISIFRYPVKFFMAAIFPMALLAAYTVDALFSEDGIVRISRKRVLTASVFAAILLAFAALFRFSDTFAAALFSGWFRVVGTDIARHNLNQTFLHAAAIWCVFTMLLYASRRRFQAWQPWAIAALVTFDLLSAGVRINPYAPRDFFSAVPDAVPIIQRERGEGRLYRTKNPDNIELSNLPSSDIFWGDRWNLETLNSSLAAIYGIPLIFHVDYDRLAHDNIATLDMLLEALPWERRLPILSAGNVTTILTNDRVETPGVEFIREIPNRSATPFYLYRNTTAANRVEFVAHWQRVASDNEALGALLTSDYDPRIRVILQEPLEASWLAALMKKSPPSSERVEIVSPPSDAVTIQGTGCKSATITEISRALTHETLFVANACDGYLVFSTPFYPGWTVMVDDAPSTLVHANYAFNAVFLAAGEHRVERRYYPASVVAGGGISLVFCGIVAIAMFHIKKT